MCNRSAGNRLFWKLCLFVHKQCDINNQILWFLGLVPPLPPGAHFNRCCHKLPVCVCALTSRTKPPVYFCVSSRRRFRCRIIPLMHDSRSVWKSGVVCTWAPAVTRTLFHSIPMFFWFVWKQKQSRGSRRSSTLGCLSESPRSQCLTVWSEDVSIYVDHCQPGPGDMA